MGEMAALARLDTAELAVRVAERLKGLGIPGVTDVVAAFETVAVYFDFSQTCGPWWEALPSRLDRLEGTGARTFTAHEIPVCYDRGEDTAEVCERLGLTAERLAEAHAEAVHVVGAVGFCPGFAYLTGLPEILCGLERRPQPRPRVRPGSVGVTGSMSAVYPTARPGGWWLIGWTPLTLVDEDAGYFPLQVGDQVRFRPVGEKEAMAMVGRRL
jgi:inhibitor of KinA